MNFLCLSIVKGKICFVGGENMAKVEKKKTFGPLTENFLFTTLPVMSSD